MGISKSGTYNVKLDIFDEEKGCDIEVTFEVDATYEYDPGRYSAADPGDCYPSHEETNIDKIVVISGTDKSVDDLNLSEENYENIISQVERMIKDDIESDIIERYERNKDYDDY